MGTIIQAIGIVVTILAILGVIFGFVLMFSPKLRAKFMSKNIKAAKHVVDENKDDIESISTNIAQAAAMATEIKARAIKKGLADNKIFCKHCGQLIDADSTFCSKCGKQL